MLDWQQRLRLRKRNAFQFDSTLSASTRLYLKALEGGRQAAALPVGRIEPGFQADVIELRQDISLSNGLSPDETLAAWIYSGDSSFLGRRWIQGQEHIDTRPLS